MFSSLLFLADFSRRDRRIEERTLRRHAEAEMNGYQHQLLSIIIIHITSSIGRPRHFPSETVCMYMCLKIEFYIHCTLSCRWLSVAYTTIRIRKLRRRPGQSIDFERSAMNIKGEVYPKIKFSPVVVFGVLSRMVLVRGS